MTAGQNLSILGQGKGISEERLKLLVAFIVLIQYLAKKRENFEIIPAVKRSYMSGALVCARQFIDSNNQAARYEQIIRQFIVVDIGCSESFFDLVKGRRKNTGIRNILYRILLLEPQPLNLVEIIADMAISDHQPQQLVYGMALALASLNEGAV